MIYGWRRGPRVATNKNVLFQGVVPQGTVPFSLGASYHVSTPVAPREIIWGRKPRGSTFAIARSTNKHLSGLYYVELIFTAATDITVLSWGFDDGTESLNSPGGQSNSIAWQGTGAVNYNNTPGAFTAASYAVAQQLSGAINLNTQLVWFRNALGNWNNNPSANPATGVGGFPIAFTPAFVFVALKNVGDSATANFGTPAFVETVPASFLAWGVPESVAVTSDMKIGVESLLSVARDSADPIELGSVVRRDAPAPFESLGTALVVTSDAGIRIESLIAVQRDATFPDASAAMTLIAEPVPAEVLTKPLQDMPAKLEDIATVQQDRPVPIEAGLVVRGDSPAGLDQLIGLRSDIVVPDEASLTVRSDGLLGDESGLAVVRDAPAPAEALSMPALAMPVGVESLGRVLSDATFNAEVFSTQFFVDAFVSIELAATVQRDAPAPAESLVVDRADAPANVESAVFVSASSPVPAESGVRVTSDMLVPVTMLGSIAQDALVNLEDIGRFSVDQVANVEILLVTARDAAAPMEAGRGVRLDMAVPAEWLGGVLALAPLPLEVRFLHPLAQQVATRSVIGPAHPTVLTGPAQAAVLKGPKQSMILVAPPGTFTLKGSS